MKREERDRGLRESVGGEPEEKVGKRREGEKGEKERRETSKRA